MTIYLYIYIFPYISLHTYIRSDLVIEPPRQIITALESLSYLGHLCGTKALLKMEKGGHKEGGSFMFR